MHYNSDLLRVANPNHRSGEISLGFIDDVALGARGKSYEESNAKLKTMMEKLGGALEWSEEHNAEFELDKTALLCLSKHRVPSKDNPRKTVPAPRPSITIRNHTIDLSHSHRFLGVIIDDKLNFKEHAAKEQDAIKEEEQADERWRVYIDGSAVDGTVGGVAVTTGPLLCCAGRSPHRTIKCVSTHTWDKQHETFSERIRKGLWTKDGKLICTPWQRDEGCTTPKHDARQVCSGCVAATLGAQKCPRAQKEVSANTL
jgi:hypothetical protein